MTSSLRPRTPRCFHAVKCRSSAICSRKRQLPFKKKATSEVNVPEKDNQPPTAETVPVETPIAPVQELGPKKVKIIYGTKDNRQSLEFQPKFSTPIAPPPPKKIKITIKQYPPRQEVEPNVTLREVKPSSVANEAKAPQMESKEVQVSNNDQFRIIPSDYHKTIMSRRVLNSEAYLNYIENLRSGSRKITKWDKSLNSGLPYRQFKRIALRKKKSMETGDYIKKNEEGQNVVSEEIVAQSLWKMRDQLLRSCLGMDVPTHDYNPYRVPKDNPSEYPPHLPL